MTRGKGQQFLAGRLDQVKAVLRERGTARPSEIAHDTGLSSGYVSDLLNYLLHRAEIRMVGRGYQLVEGSNTGGANPTPKPPDQPDPLPPAAAGRQIRP